MSDITDRLRGRMTISEVYAAMEPGHDIREEAATEIERLRAAASKALPYVQISTAVNAAQVYKDLLAALQPESKGGSDSE